MPIFEYVCSSCGNRFEKLQKQEAADQPACPACGSASVEKALSSFASPGATTTADCFTGG